jgi:hypothetical protein
MNAELSDLARVIHTEVVDSVCEMERDAVIVELLLAGIESNLEALAHVVRYNIAVEKVAAPAASVEYARRLAQRGVTPHSMVRGYRLGQQMIISWAFDQIERQERDPRVAFAAGRLFMDVTCRLVDVLAEHMVDEYDLERESWLASRSTVRVETAKELVAGDNVDVALAESALGYRLRQNHVGVVVWNVDRASSAVGLRRLEEALVSLSDAAHAAGPPLFIPNDGSMCWGWIPLGPAGNALDRARLRSAIGSVGPGVRLALGTVAAGVQGFRLTHLEADRARQVAMLANDRAHQLTSFADRGVRAAAMLAIDIETARRLVDDALGKLAVDTVHAAGLRDTLLTFLEERTSYTATAETLHLHKNTVRYRVGRALAQRGKPIDEDRLELELALVACHWLGRSVLRAEAP